MSLAGTRWDVPNDLLVLGRFADQMHDQITISTETGRPVQRNRCLACIAWSEAHLPMRVLDTTRIALPPSFRSRGSCSPSLPPPAGTLATYDSAPVS